MPLLPTRRVRSRSGARPWGLRPGVEVFEARRLLAGAITVTPVTAALNPEGDTVFQFVVTIEPNPESSTTVDYSTSDGSTPQPPGTVAAVSGVNYQGVQGSRTLEIFPIYQTSFTVDVTVHGGYRIGPTATFTLHAVRTDTAEAADGVGTILNPNSTVVTNTNSTGFGSLDAAINSSNATPGFQAVTFDLTPPPSGPAVAFLSRPLPVVADVTSINATNLIRPDGTPGFVADGSKLTGEDGQPLVVNGLTVKAGQTPVTALGLRNFGGNGVQLIGAGDVLDRVSVSDVGLAGVFVGPTAGGSLVKQSVVTRAAGAGIQLGGAKGVVLTGDQVHGVGDSGILLTPGSDGNTLLGNTVTGAKSSGLWLVGANRNTIAGNTFGAPSRNGFGTTVAPDQGNGQDGVTIVDGSSNLVGGAPGLPGNTLVGNRVVGVRVLGTGAPGTAAANNVIAGNTIGDVSGLGTRVVNGANGPVLADGKPSGLGNGFGGVFVQGAVGTLVGGSRAAQRNLVGGNGGAGIQVFGGRNNAVVGNWVGLASSGASAAGNAQDGVYINTTANAVVSQNVVSGNGLVGIRVYASAGTQVVGNKVGTDATGNAAVGNMFDGLFLLYGVTNTLISGNLISGNGTVGIQLLGDPLQGGVTGTTITGNNVGTTATGSLTLPNGLDGLFLNNAANNAVGLPGLGNTVVIPRGRSGVQIQGALASGNRVQGDAFVAAPGAAGTVFGIFLNTAAPNVIGGAGQAANTSGPGVAPILPAGSGTAAPGGPLSARKRRG